VQRVSAYRLGVILLLCAGVAAESRISAERSHLRLTGVLSQFPAQLGPYRGEDDSSESASLLRKRYWPASVVDRIYSDDKGNNVQLVIVPDSVGYHPQSICTQYFGWKILNETSATLPAVPAVHFTRTLESPPTTPDQPAGVVACDQYWRQEDRGFSQQETDHALMLPGFFCFRVLMCTEAGNPSQPDQGFATLESFAANADPEVCQFLRKAKAE
jgi:hypothetical protein